MTREAIRKFRKTKRRQKKTVPKVQTQEVQVNPANSVPIELVVNMELSRPNNQVNQESGIIMEIPMSLSIREESVVF